MDKVKKLSKYIKDYGIIYVVKKALYRYLIAYKFGKKYFPFEISENNRKSEKE